MKRALTCGLRLVMIGALVATASTVVAEPAAAAPTNYHIVNKENGWCLDSNWDGDVYINPCQTGNIYQRWQIWNGGWTRNWATTRCLKSDGYRNPSSIYTSSCVWNEPRQNWRHWNGGWYQRPQFVDPHNGYTYTAECLSRLYGSLHDVTGTTCRNPGGPNHPREEWYVRPLS